MEAQARVKSGPFARGGKSRVATAAADHDFAPAATLTPVGLFLPASDELFVYGVTAQVTSDWLVDRLGQGWETGRERSAPLTPLGLNRDTGPENHSRRTQCRPRLVDFVQQYRLKVPLASYPPSPSKYNPSERCWGMRENHGQGSLLDSMDAALQVASTLTWKGTPPVVELVTTPYQTGVKLTTEAMDRLEAQIKRLPLLGKWFVDIVPAPPHLSGLLTYF